MKTCLALLFVLLPVSAIYAAENHAPSENHEKVAPTPAQVLADRVSDIARSPKLTLKEKDEQISSAVQNAVSDAIAHLTDRAEILKVTLELTTAAAKAAPQFTHAIIEGISAIPSIAAINGALHQIQAAVIDAATKAAAAAFDSGRDRDRDHGHDHDHGGDDDDDHIVSPSH